MTDFVNFKLAQKLKEKGFRGECLLHYEATGGVYSNSLDSDDRPNQELDYSDFLKCYNDGNPIGLIDRPTISQVLKWLREKKKIHIVIDFVIGFYDHMTWYYQIALYGLETYEKESEYEYNSYEQAALAGIEYAIDNLI